MQIRASLQYESSYPNAFETGLETRTGIGWHTTVLGAPLRPTEY